MTRIPRKFGLLAAAGVFAAAGATGVVGHISAHAASPNPATTTLVSGAGNATEANQGDTADVQQANGADVQDTTSADAPEAGGAQATEVSDGAQGADADASAPCQGTGANQTGNCDTQSQSDGPDSGN